MKTMIILLAIVLCANYSIGQRSDASSSLRFSSSNQLGFLTGQTGQNFSVLSSNGIRKNTWFAGVGLGIDYYAERSVPVFADIRKDLSTRKSAPFVYANGGLNFPWLDDKTKVNAGYSKTTAGHYFDCGAGYKIHLNDDQFVTFSAGYNSKVSKAIRTYWSWAQGGVRPVEVNDKLVNQFNRVVLKIGVQF